MTVTIDLSKAKNLQDIVLQIAKKIPKEDLMEYKDLLGLPENIFTKIYKSKQRSRKELFEMRRGCNRAK